MPISSTKPRKSDRRIGLPLSARAVLTFVFPNLSVIPQVQNGHTSFGFHRELLEKVGSRMKFRSGA
jgi:hypothetical protein